MTFQNSQHHATHIDTHDLHDTHDTHDMHDTHDTHDMHTTARQEIPHTFSIATNPAQQEMTAPHQTPRVAPATSIADQLLGAFPSGTYCLPALLSLAEIVETTSVATAAVECAMRPRFLINPEWVANHAQTPEKLVMLTMHELHHVVLGHTRLFARATPLDNLVFDAVINSMLCQLFPDRAYQALLTDIYSANKFPECFLRPTNVWIDGVHIKEPPALLQPELKHLAPLYQKLYTPEGATYEELREAFRGSITDEQFVRVQLLGDHSEENPSAEQSSGGVAIATGGKVSGKSVDGLRIELVGEPNTLQGDGADESTCELKEPKCASSAGRLETRSPQLLQEVRRIVEQWPRPKNPIKGRSLHDLLVSTTVELAPRSNRGALTKLLRTMSVESGKGRVRNLRMDSVCVESPIPRLMRRSVVLNAIGAAPLLHQEQLDMKRVVPQGEQVHVYLDVSGSVSGLVSALYGAILDNAQFVHPIVHLFSTRIVDVTLQQLRAGYCVTTGGTCIGCVAQHMQQHKVRRAVIVTDGFVGAPSVVARRILEKVRIGVALTPDNSTRNDLNDLVEHWAQLKVIFHD